MRIKNMGLLTKEFPGPRARALLSALAWTMPIIWIVSMPFGLSGASVVLPLIVGPALALAAIFPKRELAWLAGSRLLRCADGLARWYFVIWLSILGLLGLRRFLQFHHWI